MVACGNALSALTGVGTDQEGDRYRTRYEMAFLVERRCGSHTLPEAAGVLAAHGTSWAPYSTAIDLAGPSGMPRQTVPFNNQAHPVRAAPILGQDTDLVLDELLGLSSDQIGHLHDDGLVAGPETPAQHG
jgi:2-methylfumaryl-CoA isomerase